MQYFIIDYYNRENFYPFTKLRSIADCRMGIFTMVERWQQALQQTIQIITPTYLQQKYNYTTNPQEDFFVFINCNLIPTNYVVEQIQLMDYESVIFDINGFVAAKTSKSFLHIIDIENKILINEVFRINSIFEYLKYLPTLIDFDMAYICKNKLSKTLPEHVICYNKKNIFVEETAQLFNCTLNANAGPIYIGEGVEIMEGATIRGPFCIAKNGVVKMNATIYGAVSVGYNSIIAGEVKNSIIMDFSNKAHHGYIGDSIVGNWCNLGAGTTNSNVKNNASEIRLFWDDKNMRVNVGNKFGCIIGDYSKLSIQSIINTGTYIGNGCNVLDNVNLEKFYADFSWGKNQQYALKKLQQDIQNWYNFKGLQFTKIDMEIMERVYNNCLV